MWRATYEKFSQNDSLKKRLFFVGKRVFVEATEDPIWGIGISLRHPDAENPQKWRSGNIMGRILTNIRKLIQMESGSNCYSAERVRYLMREITPNDLDKEDIVGKVYSFGEKVLYKTGNPEEFPSPGWPGKIWVETVLSWYKSNPKNGSTREFLDEILQKMEEIDGSGHGLLPKGMEEEWYKACLYLVEGALEFREF